MNLFSDTFYNQVSLEIYNINSQKNGMVYFIKNGKKSNLYKIGCSFDLDKRLKSYKTSFESGVFVLGLINASDCFVLEKEIHQTFREKRVNGEWFKLSFEDVLYLKEVYEVEFFNNFYKNSVSQINKTDFQLNSNPKIIDLAKNLKPDTIYYTENLFSIYKKKYGNEYKTSSWFGRDLNKCLKILGIKRKNLNKDGVRSFVIF